MSDIEFNFIYFGFALTIMVISYLFGSKVSDIIIERFKIKNDVIEIILNLLLIMFIIPIILFKLIGG